VWCLGCVANPNPLPVARFFGQVAVFTVRECAVATLPATTECLGSALVRVLELNFRPLSVRLP